jgi:pyridoxamine 5'-phosphate oxidase
VSTGILTHVDESDLGSDPLAQLAAWLAEAGVVAQPDAMTLATADAHGRPSARQVLLRGIDERGLVFFTNRTSRKARDLAENPLAALVLHWYELGRQVRVEGSVVEVDREESQTYWRTRPRASQVSAWASDQSMPVAGRHELDRLHADAAERFAEGEVPLPEFWGGYRVVPDSIEFWQHRDSRLHDRIRFVRTNDSWRTERLAP